MTGAEETSGDRTSQRHVDVIVKKTRHGSIPVISDPSADSGMRGPTDAERTAIEKLKEVKQTIRADQYENHEKVGEIHISGDGETEFHRCGAAGGAA